MAVDERSAPPMSPAMLPDAGADDVLWLVDLSGFIFRAYHAMPPLTNDEGEPTHATLGTLNMLGRMISDHRPANLAVVMDSPGRGFRGELDPNYKANRPPAPEDLIVQFKRAREVIAAQRIAIYRQDGYEADDLIANLTQRALAEGMRVVIASTDKDLFQLIVPDKVVCWDAARNRVFGPQEVEAKFGVKPERVRELLALTGDSSDNIKGVAGVGPKTAAKLLQQFESLGAMYERLDEVKRPKLRESLRTSQDAVELAYELVGLRTDLTLDFDADALRHGPPATEQLRALYTELQFTRLLERLEKTKGAQPKGGDAKGGDAKGGDAPISDRTPTYRMLNDPEQLEMLVAEARQNKQLAVLALATSNDPIESPLIGIALSASTGNAAYVPIGHRYLNAPRQLELAKVKQILGPVLADPAIRKVGHDLKFSEVLLQRHEMPLRGVRHDTMVASYLLNPEANHQLRPAAERALGMRWTELSQLLPRAKKGVRYTLEDLEIALATPLGCAQAEATMRLAEQQAPQLTTDGVQALYEDIEIPLLAVLSQMELRGVLVDPKPLAALSVEMTEGLATLEKQAYAAAGRELNLASPKQLEAVLFDELGLKSTRKTKTGRSTDHDALEAIAADHALPQLVLEHRGLAKLKGTYVDALPKLISAATGRIHTRWEQAVAATGRLSSKDPNLQNIPIRSSYGKQIREAFIAPPGMLILSADYSQIELRVLAHLSHDPVLVEAFNAAQDIHLRTAMEIFGVAEDEVTSEMRSQSKTVNFGVIYGMGAGALAKRLGIPRSQAKQFIDAYFERYQGVRSFLDGVLEDAKETKVVKTLLGRRRLLADLESGNPARRAYAERIAKNTPIQGTAADLLKLAMLKLADGVVPGMRMVLTVHDELVFEVPAEHIEEALNKTKTAMESVYPLDVPLVVDVGSGPHWAAAH